MEKESRQSGFLMPSVGPLFHQGQCLGDAYYWAINRMMDATVGAEYFSLRGWSQRGEFRVRPSETSYVDLNYFGVIDRGIGSPPLKEGGENVRLNSAGNLDGFRAVTNVDYLSSFLFRLAFNEVFSQAVYSEVKSQAFLSQVHGRLQPERICGTLPEFPEHHAGTGRYHFARSRVSMSSSVDRPLWHTPLYWSFDASAAGLSRSEPAECATEGSVQSCTPAFRTANLVGRFDVNPGISLPLLFHGWSLRSELSLQETYYTQRLVGASRRKSWAGSDQRP